MQYSVPQFIDVEDKIVGPFTGKQTLYLMVGGGLIILIFSFFQFMFFLLSLVIIVPAVLVFAFYKPKGITVAKYLTNFFKFYSSSHVYIWAREEDGSFVKQVQKKKKAVEIETKTASKSKIRELAWVLDTSTELNMKYEAKGRPDENIFRR
ncbi:MAG: PrgI family protein [Minisyncoccia bacterium]